MKLDEKEVAIVRELIRNPRASDNRIARKLEMPVMTVNRKRKKLEEKNIIRYYVSIDKRKSGIGLFEAKKLFIIKFRIGISRKSYLEKLEKDPRWRMLNCKYISFAYLGEKDGCLALIIALDAVTEDQIVEEFNEKVIPSLREKLGEDCVREVITSSIDKTVRLHHNYMPAMNMKDGKIKPDWPEDLIFVNEAAAGED